MASWRHYGRSLRSFWSTSLAAELEYPLNAVIELVSVFGNLAGSLFVLQLLFAGGTSLGGWSWNGALVVLGLFLGLLITAVNIWQLGQLQVYWWPS